MTRYRCVDDQKAAGFPVSAACEAAGVSTSGFYAWRHTQTHPCARRVADAELTERIREIHRTSRRSYGSPRVHDELRLGGGVDVRVLRLVRPRDGRADRAAGR